MRANESNGGPLAGPLTAALGSHWRGRLQRKLEAHPHGKMIAEQAAYNPFIELSTNEMLVEADIMMEREG